MRRLKTILNSRHVYRTLVWLVAQYIRLVYVTSRKRFDMAEESAPYMQGKQNAIFAFWHGRMLLMPRLCPPKRHMHVMISQHRDGVFISDVMREFSFSTIAGSTSKGGRAALMATLRALKAGDNVAITPDGPRGPVQVAAAGIAVAAKLSGKPVLPITFSSRPCIRAKSWDRFMLALPFTRIIFCVGAPIVIDREMPEEEARRKIEAAMNQQVEQADAFGL